MFAINHAAAALAVKKKFPEAQMFWLLISVQFVEILWVIFNLLNIELTTTDSVVKYVGNIHLTHIPYSHSVISSIILGMLSYFTIKYIFNNKHLAFPFAIGLISHIVLDIITHAKDIPISFLSSSLKIGSELYVVLPYVAFVLELAFGIWCWWYFGGNKMLFAIILFFNLSNFTVFSPDIIGLEKYFADNPVLLTSVIAVQIVITLLLVGYYYKNRSLVIGKNFSFNQ